MDIDFHFGTVYVLSRWAGFQAENALAIATASQFVDDNQPNILFKHPDVEPFFQASGHGPVENVVDILENFSVWVPFHFLPALAGEKEAERLVCQKGSKLAEKLRIFAEGLDFGTEATFNQNIFQLGLMLHVYADTWAHQGFSGIIDALNKVECPVVLEPEISHREHEADEQLNAVVPPLGHGKAIHWPDRPYVTWQTKEKFPEGRSNCKEFLEASQAIYGVLAKVGGSDVLELDEIQLGMLENAFQNTTDEKEENRCKAWMKLVGQNTFGFADYSEADQDIQYTKEYLLDNETFSRAFYDGLKVYYAWVRKEIEDAGVKWRED